jgi:exodeoxyribonuclease-5
VVLGDEGVHQAEQYICGFNTTRQTLNRQNTKTPGQAQAGDRLISLKNDPRLGLYNGTICVPDAVEGRTIFWSDASGRDRSCEYDPSYLLTWPMPDPQDAEGHPFDYGWCITCHKAQGSEWDSAAVIDQGNGFLRHNTLDFVNRWRYTAATRARKKLWWVTH